MRRRCSGSWGADASGVQAYGRTGAPERADVRRAPAVARRPHAPGALLAGIAIAALALAPHTAAAQDERPRHGLWASIGIGGGQVETWSDQAATATKSTLTISLRGGVTVVPALRLGLEVNGWGLESASTSDPSKGVTVNETLVIAQLYPWPRRGLYLKGGMGGGSFNTMHADDWGSKAFGATVLGAGYEVRLRRDLFLTLTADWARGPLGDADPRIVTSTGRRFRGWAVDVGIQYH
jgi:hypothetical protein